MPEKKTLERARKDKQEGKAPTTQAGEFVREEMDHIREGKHGARSTKQAIAIGLSKARRAGVELPPPKPGTTSEKTRQQAKRETADRYENESFRQTLRGDYARFEAGRSCCRFQEGAVEAGEECGCQKGRLNKSAPQVRTCKAGRREPGSA